MLALPPPWRLSAGPGAHIQAGCSRPAGPSLGASPAFLRFRHDHQRSIRGGADPCRRRPARAVHDDRSLLSHVEKDEQRRLIHAAGHRGRPTSRAVASLPVRWPRSARRRRDARRRRATGRGSGHCVASPRSRRRTSIRRRRPVSWRPHWMPRRRRIAVYPAATHRTPGPRPASSTATCASSRSPSSITSTTSCARRAPR